MTNWLLRWAVIFDEPNLTASQAATFASVRVVFLDCPFLDCLNRGVTTSTVGVTTFTNHSEQLSYLKTRDAQTARITRSRQVFLDELFISTRHTTSMASVNIWKNISLRLTPGCIGDGNHQGYEIYERRSLYSPCDCSQPMSVEYLGYFGKDMESREAHLFSTVQNKMLAGVSFLE